MSSDKAFAAAKTPNDDAQAMADELMEAADRALAVNNREKCVAVVEAIYRLLDGTRSVH